MAAKPKKIKTIDKWKRKKYFSILAPKNFQERELGQTLAYEPSELNGRCITSNLMMITGNIKKQDINVTFKINKVLGDTAYTVFERYEIVPASIKRKVRRQKDRLDESFNCVTKDNQLVRMKPLVVTATKISRSTRIAMRDKMIQIILAYARKTDYDSLVIDVVNDKLQREVGTLINKISPVRFVAFRIMKYMGENKGPAPVIVEDALVKEEPEETADEEDSDDEEAPEGDAEDKSGSAEPESDDSEKE